MALATPTGDIDVTELAKTLREQGMITPGQGNNGQKSPFQQMMMMAMLRNASDKQLAGFGLGKLLRQGFDSWKDKYDMRGMLKDEFNAAKPEDHEKLLQKYKEMYPGMSGYIQKFYDERFPKPPQPTQEAAQPLLLGTETQEAVRQAFANAQMPQNVQGLLGQLTAPSQGVPAANEAFGDISTTSNIPLSTDFWERLKNTGLVR